MGRTGWLMLMAVAVAGCGSSHGLEGDGGTDDGGLRDSSPRDAGRDVEPPPPECAVDTTRPGPYATTFRFVNESGAELWVHQGCRVRFSVSSCASGYEPITMWADCTLDCSESSACVACGACLSRGLQVTPEEPVEVDWGGHTYEFDETSMGCRCHRGFVAPAGKYRVTVPIYGTEDTMVSEPLRQVTHDFELPAPDGEVVVPLDVAP